MTRDVDDAIVRRVVLDWEEILSIGEQQRLAFARLVSTCSLPSIECEVTQPSHGLVQNRARWMPSDEVLRAAVDDVTETLCSYNHAVLLYDLVGQLVIMMLSVRLWYAAILRCCLGTVGRGDQCSG